LRTPVPSSGRSAHRSSSVSWYEEAVDQLRPEDLDAMTAEQILQANREGRLEEIKRRRREEQGVPQPERVAAVPEPAKPPSIFKD
jgi:hypothetical protein